MKAWYWYHDVQVIKKFKTEDQARRELQDPNTLIDVPWQGEGDFTKYVKVPAPQIEVIEKEEAEDEYLDFEAVPEENCHHGNTWNSNCAECIEESNGEGLCEHGYDPWGGCDECDKGQ